MLFRIRPEPMLSSLSCNHSVSNLESRNYRIALFSYQALCKIMDLGARGTWTCASNGCGTIVLSTIRRCPDRPPREAPPPRPPTARRPRGRTAAAHARRARRRRPRRPAQSAASPAAPLRGRRAGSHVKQALRVTVAPGREPSCRRHGRDELSAGAVGGGAGAGTADTAH